MPASAIFNVPVSFTQHSLTKSDGLNGKSNGWKAIRREIIEDGEEGRKGLLDVRHEASSLSANRQYWFTVAAFNGTMPPIQGSFMEDLHTALPKTRIPSLMLC